MKNLKMNQKFLIAVLLALFLAMPVFAQLDIQIPDFYFISFLGLEVQVEEESAIPFRISNNRFYLESLRLTRLAQETYEYGDYDASAGFAHEAILYADLSDEFVASQLIAEARRLLDWAELSGVATLHNEAYIEARDYFLVSEDAYFMEEWGEAIIAAIRTIEILSNLEELEGYDRSVLPRYYTVRTWANERDCLWNIAGYSFVYGDPWRWRELYEVNRSRMPEPNNPNLIEPGFILEIPSIRGEVRHGTWRP